MPVISLDYKDFEELSGMDKDTIIERIPMMGCDIERIEDDHIDIEFFPNRPDLYSVEGVARAVRGFMGKETGLCEYKVSQSDIKFTKDTDIDSIRPYIVSAVVRNVKFTSSSIESLMALQESMHWAVGRNRRKVSIGVHDLSKITPPFRYIAQDPGFKFVPLDFTEPMSMKEILEKHPKGVKFAFILEDFNKYPLILDANDNVVSFPPIINGELTRVTEETTDLLIEITGLDPAVSTALNIVVTALAERGGKVESVMIDGKQTPDLKPATMKLDSSEVKELLGFALTDDEIISYLGKMRFGARKSGDGIEVSIPSYRSDIMHTWDLIEDIGIAYGYGNIKPELPETSAIGTAHPISELRDSMREIMVGLGYYDVMPFTLSSERLQFDMMRREKPDGITRILYPISEDHTIVRSTILPNLLEILSINRHREQPQRIFEAGEVIVDCQNRLRLGAVAIHPQANFTEIQSVVDAVMRERRISYEVKESGDPAFLGGRRADIFVVGLKIGVFGELHPEVISNFGMEHPIIGFELEL
ncbi:MAG: phenylalanine--tRNA ligase subunit beta [Candidatus Methanoperedens sp.]|jgi:phenylalanyl-tRNA synthetase beta chain|nr:phenylalanine--tRNA ligase subunit beta [Candidatus Methanoperedens sp.]PKL53124.1 MAG: phenylalanine--tRNA ligase subunit beta [Candidatus Methanoperedenaceae archaeon HGW-Methanoperedenaceae-1]